MMTDRSGANARGWLESRLGDVPEELAAAIRAALGAVVSDSTGTLADALADAALAELDSVLGATERDRRTALRLLSADALLTYAFEAAADPAVGGSATLAESLAERMGPRGALGGRIAAIECPAE
jgi:hypothetical protein